MSVPGVAAFHQAAGSAGGSGDVTGPASSTDNAVARFDGAGGKTLQNSTVTIDDTGNVTFPARILGKQGADVASAAGMTLGNGNFFVVTGTATIRSINSTGWTIGSVAVLKFSDSLTVSHDDGAATFAPLILAGAANFSATANDTLTLLLDETVSWIEISRTVI